MTTGFYRLGAFHAAAAAAGLLVAALAGCGAATVAPAPAPANRGETPPATERVSETRRLMGVPWTITVHAASEAAGRAAIAAGFGEVARLERILSDYDPESELSRLSGRAPTPHPAPVGDDLWRVLERAVAMRDATHGAFDPTVGPLTTLWRQARRSGRLPLPDKLSRAREAVGPDTLRLDSKGHAVELRRPGMRLDLGGIGMGYAVDRAMEVIGRHGIAAAMVDASGDVAVSGPPPGTAGWSIAVAPLRVDGGGVDPADSEERLCLVHAAVTTSGDAWQAVEIDGIRYSHIVDPRTGLGVVGSTAVTVVAADCTTADALATAASVLGPERSAAVIEAAPGCAARFVWLEDGRVRHAHTARWSSQFPQTSSQLPREPPADRSGRAG
ncbi:MAG: FAD:protein FMN transferase [Planctomycetia bacterium]